MPFSTPRQPGSRKASRFPLFPALAAALRGGELTIPPSRRYIEHGSEISCRRLRRHKLWTSFTDWSPRSNRTLLSGGLWLLAALVIIYVAQSDPRHRRRPFAGLAEPSIDVAALPRRRLRGGPRLEFYNLPVRLAVIVLAPAGRWANFRRWNEIHDVLDAIVPGLADVAVAHQSIVYRWPPQFSSAASPTHFSARSPCPATAARARPGPRRPAGSRWAIGPWWPGW